MKKHIITFIVLSIIYVIIDYFNVPSRLFLNFGNINVELLSAIINALVVIILFIISFCTIEKHQQKKADEAEKRELQKGENIKSIAKLLMKNTYEQCLDTLKLISDKEILLKNIIPKVDFDKPYSENSFEANLINKPFDNFDHIISFSQSGHITKKELEDYLNIKTQFRTVLQMKITFFDIGDIQNKTDEQMFVERKLNDDFTSLLNYLKISVNN